MWAPRVVACRRVAPNLDPRTILAYQERRAPQPPHAGAWQITYYPEAKEATLCPVPTIGQPRERCPDPLPPELQAARDRQNKARALRRARGEARRYARTNGLRYLWVLTYRGKGCHDWPVMVEHLTEFYRALKHLNVPALVVPEWHPGGHGLHLNLALGRWIDWRYIQRAWPHGNVKAPKLRQGGRSGRRKLDAGTVASYITGYLSRGASVEDGEMGKPGAVTGTPRPDGGHRYFVSQGHKPARYVDARQTLEDAEAFLSAYFGRPPSYVWRSWESEDEDDSPFVIAAWHDYWPRKPKREAT